MATKKNNYIDAELNWLEARAAEIKRYVDDNPYHEIEDRIKGMYTPKGVTDKLIQSRESQQTAIRNSLKDYALLIEAISQMREKEEQKQSNVRGGQNLSPLEGGII